MKEFTIFYNEEGKELGNCDKVLQIPLYKGMKMTIHGYSNAFTVVDWNYHYGHEDENPGLRIILSN